VVVPGALYFGPTFEVLAEPLLTRWERAIVDENQRGGREAIAAATFEAVMRQPLIGYGLQANVVVGEAVRGEARNLSPHNTYLALLVTFGLLGAVPWFLMLIAIAIGVWRNRQHDTAWLFLALGALYAVAMFVGDLTASKYLFSAMALAACLPQWMADERRMAARVMAPPSAASREAEAAEAAVTRG